MTGNKLKAEKREGKKVKRKKVAKASGTLAGQVLKLQVNRRYGGDVKKLG
ncbi:MAG: hypothetical protein WCT37_01555 [Patescibacteria group bacterium]